MKNLADYLKKLKFLFLAAVIFGLSFPALAQTPADELRLTTSPLPINLKVAPGSSISTAIKIKNDGNQTENLKISVMKFKADPVTGATILADRAAGDSYFDWVTFSDPTFSIDPGEWKTVTATFSVPSTAAFDYYYAIVFFRADQTVKPGDRQTVLNGGTATMVLLTADAPGAVKQLQLDQFTVNKNIFEFLPATFDVKLQNTGNVHVIPQGNIFISKDGQKDVATLDVNSSLGSILPDSPRTYSVDWADGFPVYVPKIVNGSQVDDAKGNLIQELKWDWANASKLRWGKYTAKLLMVYDDGTRDVPMEGTVTFWVIPWRLLGGGLIVLIFVLIGLKSTLYNWYKKISLFFAKDKVK